MSHIAFFMPSASAPKLETAVPPAPRSPVLRDINERTGDEVGEGLVLCGILGEEAVAQVEHRVGGGLEEANRITRREGLAVAPVAGDAGADFGRDDAVECRELHGSSRNWPYFNSMTVAPV